MVFCIVLIGLSSCTPRHLNPLSVERDCDKPLSCQEIEVERQLIDQKVRAIFSSKHAEATLPAEVGSFMHYPWLFIDLEEVNQVEIDAYRLRFNQLQQLSAQQRCCPTPINKPK